MLLEAMIINYLYWFHIILRFMPVFQYMYMDWKMVIAIKHKPKPKEDKNSGMPFSGKFTKDNPS